MAILWLSESSAIRMRTSSQKVRTVLNSFHCRFLRDWIFLTSSNYPFFEIKSSINCLLERYSFSLTSVPLIESASGPVGPLFSSFKASSKMLSPLFWL